jgi:hypothetical protein
MREALTANVSRGSLMALTHVARRPKGRCPLGAPSHRPLLPLDYEKIEQQRYERLRNAFTSYEARQYAIEQYCVIEAKREVNAMLTGQGYLWRCFDERDWDREDDLQLVKPLNFFEFVK